MGQNSYTKCGFLFICFIMFSAKTRGGKKDMNMHTMLTDETPVTNLCEKKQPDTDSSSTNDKGKKQN